MHQPFLSIGTSGFSYPQWEPGFYPKGAKPLVHYAQHFDSVEINNSFHRLLHPETLKRWATLVPEHFRFAVKAWRGITHDGRLADHEAIEKFMALLPYLEGKLGPILFQLPANLPFDKNMFAAFLDALPSGHRYAVEPRHPSWDHEQALGLMFDHDVALVHAHTKGWTPRVYTAPFAYVRLHGTKAAYKGSYMDAFLKQLPAELSHHALDHAYVYFNNTVEGIIAIENAQHLQLFARIADEKISRHG